MHQKWGTLFSSSMREANVRASEVAGEEALLRFLVGGLAAESSLASVGRGSAEEAIRAPSAIICPSEPSHWKMANDYK